MHEYMELLPLNDTLWAIKKTLDHYGINNSSFIIASKNKISEYSNTFITQWNGDFVLVEAITSNQVVYFDSTGTHKIAIDEFLKTWSGIVLSYKSTDSSSEPNYVVHRKTQIRNYLYKGITVTAAIVLSVFAITRIYDSALVCIELMLSLTGLSLSLLLLKKHLHIPSPTAEKLCSIVSHGKCDENVNVNLKAVHLNSINLSELGISFFCVNTIALLLFSVNAIPVLFLSLLLALPLSIWSIGWQLVKRSWCTLCVFVMLTLWVALGVLLSETHILIDVSTIARFICILCCYWILLKATNYFSMQHTRITRQKERINALQRTLYDADTWNAILASGNTSYPIDIESSSSLLFGSMDSEFPRITVIGNPFCNPCARMHHRLQPLLEAGFQIQYIYTYFNPDLFPINKEIVASYFINGPERTWNLITQWYTGDRNLHPFNPKNVNQIPDNLIQRVLTELEKQDKWIENSGITTTPTILVNGKVMPSHYAVEDLLYIY